MTAVILAMVLGTAGPSFGPFRTAKAPVTRDAKAAAHAPEKLPSADPLAFAFDVYQATLSSQDGPRCAHFPTCSAYGVRAVRLHPLAGFGLTVDRMWRQARSSWLRPLPRDFRWDPARYYDPVEANDFWMRGVEDWRQPELLPPRPRQ